MLDRFELVVFDWDGTLIDSTATIARSIQAAAADLGLPVPAFERAAHVIGLGLKDALAYAVPELKAEQAADFSARYRYHYFAAEDSLALFAGARDLLDALKARDVPLAIATGKSQAGLARALAATALGAHFVATRCADQTHPKPHPAMVLELAGALDADPRRTLVIGDTTHDMRMAAAAGAGAVGVTYGAHPRAQLEQCNPLALVASIGELRRWLMNE